jgi:RimJ/RimL family protein N-acetyltransferase
VKRPVEWDEHNNWVEAVVAGKTNKELYIIESEGEGVGQLRLDFDNNEAEVSISLFKSSHSKGVATRALLIAVTNPDVSKRVNRLIAEVNKNNPASQRLFEKVGFHLREQEGDWLKYKFEL